MGSTFFLNFSLIRVFSSSNFAFCSIVQQFKYSKNNICWYWVYYTKWSVMYINFVGIPWLKFLKSRSKKQNYCTLISEGMPVSILDLFLYWKNQWECLRALKSYCWKFHGWSMGGRGMKMLSPWEWSEKWVSGGVLSLHSTTFIWLTGVNSSWITRNLYI